MRRVLSSVLHISSPLRALTCAIVLGSGLGLAAQPAAPTVDEIIAKNIASKGGLEKVKAINSTRITATASMQGQQFPMVVLAKRPNLTRQEVTIEGQKIVQSFDGTSGWALRPAMGSEAVQLPAAQSNAMKNQSEFESALVDYKAKGNKVTMVGPETIGARQTFHLHVEPAGGTPREYYLDAESGLESRVDSTIEQDGQKGTLSVELSDYRDVDGVKMPFSLKQSLNGTPVAEMKVDKIELNAPLDDALFRLGGKR